MARPYRSTPVFDETSLPAALRADHRTKPGVWGVIRILEGAARLTRAATGAETILRPGEPALVWPQETHAVTPLGAMRLRVDFYDEEPDPSAI